MGDVARVVVVACLRRHLEFFGKLLVSCSCACVGEDRPVGLLIWAPNIILMVLMMMILWNS